MGVTCDKDGHVIGLDLSGEFISGGFDNSSTLFSLQHLQSLNLAANCFLSKIPSGFNKLENLTYLNLSESSFMGQIPIEISQLTRLATLDLSSISNARGPKLLLENPNLQKLVQNLTSIRQLYLDGVDRTAPGHEWSNALSSLHDLQELSMPGCNLSGPLDPSLARLENLSVIVLDNNNLSSPMPETFSHFKNLTILSLNNCGLTGTFPHKIFNIGTLSVIDISWNNNLHGFLPEFPSSGSLYSLSVSHTNFSGAIPLSIGNMRNLPELDLSNCGFKGTIPNSLSNLTKLSYLALSSNSFTGPMTLFSVPKKLTRLGLSHNELSGIIPSSHFEGMHNLVQIDLSYNSFTGSIPSSLFTLPSLERIQLSLNKFSHLDEFINVKSSTLEFLDISNNNLSGPFPVSFFQLNLLMHLSLSSNKFDWSVLPKIHLVNVTNADMLPFPNILYLDLASCNLKTIPGFLKNCSTLSSLDLSDNQIQGIVPHWIWKPNILWNLNISHNLLIGLEGPLTILLEE
ncbi:hypothetical protein JHK87_006258 [Glycine soja]|nr:hypothetical protein JHK87_006258 [Glycine soja]